MNWDSVRQQEEQKDYYKQLDAFLLDEYLHRTIYPPAEKVFNALKLTALDKVKCVIIGQDPYHEPGQAMGLSFSVPQGVAIPRSLQNIYKELQNECGCYIPNNGDLTYWAEQGVLLLNSVLTVRAHNAGSHAGKGWEQYTDVILQAINKQDRPIVYMLWGNYAKAKAEYVDNVKHLVLKASHPSPYSANYGFFGCGHFKKCNEFLESNGITPIDWQIKNIMTGKLNAANN